MHVDTLLQDRSARNAARNKNVLQTRRFMPWSWWKVLFGSVLAGHALIRLLSHWSVGVRSIVAFKDCSKWSQASHCKVSQGSTLHETPAFTVCCWQSCTDTWNAGIARHFCRQEGYCGSPTEGSGKLYHLTKQCVALLAAFNIMSVSIH